MASEKKMAPAEKPETGIPDPYERVEIFVPRGEKNGDPNLFVSVNEYTALLPRGQKSVVPRYVAEEVQRAAQADADYWALSEAREIRE